MCGASSAFRSAVQLHVIEGDLLDQDVEAVVNPWNRNLFPWWLLLPQGVSGAIKQRAGLAPFRELRAFGVLPLGAAVVTSAGRLPFRAIIHVAGINLLWRASPRSIQESVRSAVRVAAQAGFRSLALPLIGAGTGGIGADGSLRLMLGVLDALSFDGEIRVVRYRSAS